jgi:hypothetical protein
MIIGDGSSHLGVQEIPNFLWSLFLTGVLCCLLLLPGPSSLEARGQEAGKEGSWIEIKPMEEPRFTPPDPGAMDIHDPRLLPENWSVENKKPQPPEMVPPGPTADESLFLAVGQGDIQEVERLLDMGAQVDYRLGASGLTPLMVAEQEAVARILLMRGANPNAADRDGATPLHHAVLKEEGERLISLLLQAGADVNPVAPGRSRETPILSAQQNYFEGNDHVRGDRVIRLLARHGADINAADDMGYTLLIIGVVNRKMDLVKLMLDLGADSGLRTIDGKTALDYARELGFMEIVNLLKNEGVAK